MPRCALKPDAETSHKRAISIIGISVVAYISTALEYFSSAADLRSLLGKRLIDSGNVVLGEIDLSTSFMKILFHTKYLTG